MGLNDLADLGVNLTLPPPAAEHPVMADAALQMVRLHIDPHPGAKIQRRESLAGGANVIPLAFHGQQRGAPDRGGRDRPTVEDQFPQWQMIVLKDALSLDPTQDEVVEGTGIIEAGLSGHGGRIAERVRIVNL